MFTSKNFRNVYRHGKQQSVLNQLPPLAAHTATKYCHDIFYQHYLSLTTSSKAYFRMSGNSSLKNIEFKIMWEEPLDVRKFIHTKYCA